MKLKQVMWVYNLLLPVALLIGLPAYIIKAIRRGGARNNFAQRFGYYDQALLDRWREQEGKCIWIHAVSVGEVLVGLKIIQALLEEEPGQALVLSTTTPTGYRLAGKECPQEVCVVYNPVDLPWVVSRALNLIQPRHLILVEAEVWPNLVYQARRRGVGVSLVNARLSARSERRFNKFGKLTRPIFGMLDCVCVQFERDILRWQGLGVERGRIHEVGSIKYDEGEQEKPTAQVAEMENVLRGFGVSLSQPVLLAGSTHAGEEAWIGSIYRELCKLVPGLVYIVVPRHMERAGEVVKDLEGIGLRPQLRTKWETTLSLGTAVAPGQPVCLVVDTTGELRAWYYLASVVVIGKSFLGRGGQNPVEAIMAGKPVITGPHMGNFKVVMNQLVELRGVVEVSGSDELSQAIMRVLNDPGESGLMVERGRQAIHQHRGAAIRAVRALRGAGEK
jgi:3-deoxy-D-manno-octulosonic-acid transferase